MPFLHTYYLVTLIFNLFCIFQSKMMNGVCGSSGGAVIISTVDSRASDASVALSGLATENITDSIVTDSLESPQHAMSPQQLSSPHNLRYYNKIQSYLTLVLVITLQATLQFFLMYNFQLLSLFLFRCLCYLLY